MCQSRNSKPFGGFEDNPEDYVVHNNIQYISFHSHTSGDLDGVHITFDPTASLPSHITVQGTIGGYVKVGNP